jgi:hypothetical protein
MSDAMTVERTEIDGHLAYEISHNPEKVHHTKARWTADIEILKKAMFGMKRMRLRPFLEKEQADSIGHYWETASVASVLRLVNKLKYWGYITLADPITEAELGKVLGQELSTDDPAHRACMTYTHKVIAEDEPTTSGKEMIARLDQRDYGDEDPEPEPIPSGVYWCDEGGNFYATETDLRMDVPFYRKWAGRRAEFPQSGERASVTVTLDEIKPEHLACLMGRPLPPGVAIGDDPINPKHYGGTACAEIGELLTANSYQVLKYNWRLGEKDDPCVEIGKSLWYLDREIALVEGNNAILPGDDTLPDYTFFDARLAGRPEHVRNVARALISWNRHGNIASLRSLRKLLQRRLDDLNGCKDWGSGLAI